MMPYGIQQPSKGININVSLHITIHTGVLIKTVDGGWRHGALEWQHSAETKKMIPGRRQPGWWGVARLRQLVLTLFPLKVLMFADHEVSGLMACRTDLGPSDRARA